MNIELLRDLSNAFGPPGQEEEPREILKAEMEEFADDVNVDVMGNIFFHHRGERGYPKIMLDAHTDEVAFITTYIDDRGFLRFSTLGGIPANIMPGQRIIMKGRKGYLRGIVGTKPPQVMKEGEQKKPVSMEELFIDIGAESREAALEKGCHVGMTGVFDVEFTELGSGYLRGKAFDCRAGCAVMAWAFKANRTLRWLWKEPSPSTFRGQGLRILSQA